MSYYKELKEFILELKGGGFFLSPRDIWFLSFLEEEGVPIEVVREGIRKFFIFYPPERRKKLPLWLSFGEIRKLQKLHLKNHQTSSDWRERFQLKLKIAKDLLSEDLHTPEPENMVQAEEILQNLEKHIAKKIWEQMSTEERAQILNKFKVFRKDQEIFKAMIKRELFKLRGLETLSLFVG